MAGPPARKEGKSLGGFFPAGRRAPRLQAGAAIEVLDTHGSAAVPPCRLPPAGAALTRRLSLHCPTLCPGPLPKHRQAGGRQRPPGGREGPGGGGGPGRAGEAAACCPHGVLRPAALPAAPCTAPPQAAHPPACQCPPLVTPQGCHRLLDWFRQWASQQGQHAASVRAAVDAFAAALKACLDPHMLVQPRAAARFHRRLQKVQQLCSKGPAAVIRKLDRLTAKAATAAEQAAVLGWGGEMYRLLTVVSIARLQFERCKYAANKAERQRREAPRDDAMAAVEVEVLRGTGFSHISRLALDLRECRALAAGCCKHAGAGVHGRRPRGCPACRSLGWHPAAAAPHSRLHLVRTTQSPPCRQPPAHGRWQGCQEGGQLHTRLLGGGEEAAGGRVHSRRHRCFPGEGGQGEWLGGLYSLTAVGKLHQPESGTAAGRAASSWPLPWPPVT